LRVGVRARGDEVEGHDRDAVLAVVEDERLRLKRVADALRVVEEVEEVRRVEVREVEPARRAAETAERDSRRGRDVDGRDAGRERLRARTAGGGRERSR